MKRFALPLALVCVTLFSACGSGNESKNSSGEVVVDSSGNCKSEVISDYNTVVSRCKYMSTDEDARNCKSSAQSFVDKYPNLSCKAAVNSSSSVNQAPTTVTNANFQQLIQKLTAAGY